MDGWIILHKKIWQSGNWKLAKNKSNIILVWLWLLTHTDKNGEVTCGRYQIAEETGIHPSSVKRALEHIRNEMTSEVTYHPTSTHTKFCILNWQKYQNPSNKEVTINRPSSDQQVTTNKQETINNKQYIYTNLKITNEELESLKAQFPNKEVKVECDKADDWLANSTKRYKDFVAFMRGWLRRSESKVVSKVFVPPVTKPVSQEGLSKFASMKQKFGLGG